MLSTIRPALYGAGYSSSIRSSCPKPSSSLLKQLEPVETMDQAVGVLARLGMSYRKTVGVIDALSIGGEAAEQMANLPPGSVIIFPGGSDLRINRVREEVTELLNQADRSVWPARSSPTSEPKSLSGTRLAKSSLRGQKAVRRTLHSRRGAPEPSPDAF